MWKSVLSYSAFNSFDRCIFMLEHNPPNWLEVMNTLYEITRKTAGGQPTSDYEKELSICHCVCYSDDEDLFIGKVDLPENVVLSILEDIAREENLELVIKRES